jgi:hypothetical protein
MTKPKFKPGELVHVIYFKEGELPHSHEMIVGSNEASTLSRQGVFIMDLIKL